MIIEIFQMQNIKFSEIKSLFEQTRIKLCSLVFNIES